MINRKDTMIYGFRFEMNPDFISELIGFVIGSEDDSPLHECFSGSENTPYVLNWDEKYFYFGKHIKTVNSYDIGGWEGFVLEDRIVDDNEMVSYLKKILDLSDRDFSEIFNLKNGTDIAKVILYSIEN